MGIKDRGRRIRISNARVAMSMTAALLSMLIFFVERPQKTRIPPHLHTRIGKINAIF